MNYSHNALRLHLDAVMSWLARSQRLNGGFSASYSYFRGWSLPYPETTGYIIETMLKYSSIQSTEYWWGIVHKASEWLLSLQFPNGGFPAGYGIKSEPRVFNTGMILFGISSVCKISADERFRDAGMRALLWLAKAQNSDGSWTVASLDNKPHAYHSRVAWGMLELAKTLDVADNFLPSIKLANNWVVAQQNENGWFNHSYLIGGLPPLTHNIAYTIRGLLECGDSLGEEKWVAAAVRAAIPVYYDWKSSGRLAAGYYENWIRGPNFRCVTGDAQFGIIWYRLWQITGETYWLDASKRMANQVAHTQNIHHLSPNVRGGIPGAWPIWGRYLRFSYPNWAAKFFADLIMNLLGI